VGGGELGLGSQSHRCRRPSARPKSRLNLAMNPKSLVPTLEEEDGFTLWDPSVVRYLASKAHKNGVLEPKDPKQRALASQWMDWQLVGPPGPAITPAFWGLIRTPVEKPDLAASKLRKKRPPPRWNPRKQLGPRRPMSRVRRFPTATSLLADGYRYRQLVPGRPARRTSTVGRHDAKRKAFQITSAAFR